MKGGSLFSGIGGLELGIAWAFSEAHFPLSFEWQVEQDEFCRSVLAKHWPDVDRSVTDVRAASASVLARVDLICGGFPCQDVSGAGKGAGIAVGTRSGLWYEYLRIVSELAPRFVVVENVESGKGKWLCEVREGLHQLGYRTRAMGIAAADVGAPHRRQRIFVLAYADCLESQRHGGSGLPETKQNGNGMGTPAGRSSEVADANHEGLEGRHEPEPQCANERSTGSRGSARPIYAMADSSSLLRDGGGDHVGCRDQGTITVSKFGNRDGERTGGDWRRAEPIVGGESHGLPRGLDRWPSGPGEAQCDWEAPRVSRGATNRARRLKALGNAVVPQCAAVVGRVIIQMIKEGIT